jgi:DNA (cytosine-5)-methyltransferase 1
MRSGIAYPLPPLEPHTSGTGFGSSPTHSIPTPTASDHIERRPTRTDKAAAFNPDTNKAVTLDRFVKLWPTPRARDWRSGKTGPGILNHRGDPKKARPLNEAVLLYPTPTASRRSGLQSHGVNVVSGNLNPTWVEWLMGYPTEWTALERSETPSSRKSQS